MQKINLNISAAVCVLMMTLAVPAGAVTHYVLPGESIQAAIIAAEPFDEIEVAPGTYNEAINFNGKAITLRSSNPNDPNIVAATVIDGTGNYHVVQYVSGEGADTILEGFTITGGNANGPEPNDRCGAGMFKCTSRPAGAISHYLIKES